MTETSGLSLWQVGAVLYLFWNIAVFFIYGLDKGKAKRGKLRIPERTLFLCAFFLGGAGAWLGMSVFRHKTKHRSFRILIPLFTVLNLVFLGLCVYEGVFAR